MEYRVLFFEHHDYLGGYESGYLVQVRKIRRWWFNSSWKNLKSFNTPALAKDYINTVSQIGVYVL